MKRREGKCDQRYGNAYGKKDGNVQGLWNNGVQGRHIENEKDLSWDCKKEGGAERRALMEIFIQLGCSVAIHSLVWNSPESPR